MAFEDIDGILNVFTILAAAGCIALSVMQMARRRPELKILGLDIVIAIGNALIIVAMAADMLADAGITGLDLQEAAVHVALFGAVITFGMTVAFLKPYVE